MVCSRSSNLVELINWNLVYAVQKKMWKLHLFLSMLLDTIHRTKRSFNVIVTTAPVSRKPGISVKYQSRSFYFSIHNQRSFSTKNNNAPSSLFSLPLNKLLSNEFEDGEVAEIVKGHALVRALTHRENLCKNEFEKQKDLELARINELQKVLQNISDNSVRSLKLKKLWKINFFWRWKNYLNCWYGKLADLSTSLNCSFKTWARL